MFNLLCIDGSTFGNRKMIAWKPIKDTICMYINMHKYIYIPNLSRKSLSQLIEIYIIIFRREMIVNSQVLTTSVEPEI
jgi:hypothetical protein